MTVSCTDVRILKLRKPSKSLWLEFMIAICYRNLHVYMSNFKILNFKQWVGIETSFPIVNDELCLTQAFLSWKISNKHFRTCRCILIPKCVRTIMEYQKIKRNKYLGSTVHQPHAWQTLGRCHKEVSCKWN